MTVNILLLATGCLLHPALGPRVDVRIEPPGDAAQFRNIRATIGNPSDELLFVLWPAPPRTEVDVVPGTPASAPLKHRTKLLTRVRLVGLTAKRSGLVEVAGVLDIIAIAPHSTLRLIDVLQFSGFARQPLTFCVASSVRSHDWPEADQVLVDLSNGPGVAGRLMLKERSPVGDLAETVAEPSLAVSGLSCFSVMPPTPPFPVEGELQQGSFAR